MGSRGEQAQGCCCGALPRCLGVLDMLSAVPFPPGPNCQTNINECASNPCLNQGTCIDDVAGYKCNCLLPYTGEGWVGPVLERAGSVLKGAGPTLERAGPVLERVGPGVGAAWEAVTGG